ncbi:MAG: uncharacterized protein QOK05_1522 [Chloroflexota bacterium]|jgi:uncharacterized protein (DUF1684 family)|nr:uncharacterized protein [Chloroflexota bacterium]
MGAEGIQGYLDLVDWRRRVADLYRLARTDGVGAFREGKDRLFAAHSQTPIPEEHLAAFGGLDYYDPDPALKVPCTLAPPELEADIEIDTGGPDGVITYRRAGRVHFELGGQECGLTVFSIVGYGGGLFLPFRDRTSGPETYGGGRYLFDTIKNHVPMPMAADGEPMVELDFNYAYNPSCAYNHLWACPLAPQENWLPVPVLAGERNYPSPS